MSLSIAIFFLHSHFWNFFFLGEPGHQWWEAATWSNVAAVLPLAVLGTVTYWVHKVLTKDIEKFDAEKAHDEHSKHLRAILDALDPEVESDSVLDYIAGQVNEDTPGGLRTIRDEIKLLAHGSNGSDAP